MRIVSLLPSATEIICALGLNDQLVGVTHECDYPAQVTDLPRVTTTIIPHDASSRTIDNLVRERLTSVTALYSLKMDVIKKLQPDLIVTQALCDVCAVAESEVLDAINQLEHKPELVNLEPMTLDDVLDTIKLVGEATSLTDKADSVVKELLQRINNVRNRTGTSLSERDFKSVVFLEWLDPLFNAGHWTPTLIEYAGGNDLLGNKHLPSQTTEWGRVVELNPEYLFVACCGYDIKRTLQDVEIMKSYPGWSDLQCVKKKNVFITDGNAYFSRSGPRLVESLEIMAHALHPEIHPSPRNAPAAIRIL